MFAKLLGRIDFENLMVVNQAELAKELGMHRQHVQRSIKRLIALGVILEGPKIGISRSYRLNPEFGWKGSARNHVIALDQERKKRMANAGIKGRDRGRPASPAGSPRARPGHAGHVHRVNPREAPTGCLRSNPEAKQGRTYANFVCRAQI